VNIQKLTIPYYWDIVLALSIGLLSFLLYAHFALQLAETVYDDYLNLAFDFDTGYYQAYLTSDQPVNGSGPNFKHPLWFIFRPIALFFIAVGYPAKAATGLLMALFGGLTVMLSYLFARLYGAGRAESAAATLFFAASCTTLFTSFIVETYGWANFSLALLWCVYLWSYRQPSGNILARQIASTLVFGITLTNIMQVIIAEFFLKVRTKKPLRSLSATMLFAMVSGVITLIVLILIQPQDMWLLVSNPVNTLRTLYWMKTKGDTVGLLQVLKTFFVYSFFAPEFDYVKLSTGITMLDFREYRFSMIAQCAATVWIVFWLANLVLGVRRWRDKLLLPLVVVIVVNLLFHLGYQFRGSIFIYAAHLQFPIFAVSLTAAPWIRQQGWRWRSAYTAVFLVFAMLAFGNNLERCRQFIDYFKDIQQLPANVYKQPIMH
jgi:hypothetical protein